MRTIKGYWSWPAGLSWQLAAAVGRPATAGRGARRADAALPQHHRGPALVLQHEHVVNTGSDSVIITTTAVDADAQHAWPASSVAFSVDSGADRRARSATETDADGTSRSTVGIGADQSNRTITVTATAAAVD